MNSEDFLYAMVPVVVIVAGVVVLVAGMRYRAKALELVYRERVAMIERGLMPPDLDPSLDPSRLRAAGVRSRSFSAGIVAVGFGLGLMSLIGIAGQSPLEGIGIGGAVVVIGAAFIVRGLLAPQDAPSPPATRNPPGPPVPPPSDVMPR